ncbi:MAG: MFS transporter [Desulfobacterales bacterium]
MKIRMNIYYGWWIVSAFFITLFMAAGIAATHTVFFKSISGDFGWSRTAFSTVLSINVILGSLTAPIWGRLVDRRGARLVVPLGVVMVGGSLLLLSTMSSLTEAYLFYIFLAIGAGGITLIPISSAVSRWFVRRRGLAMGVTLAGISIGGMFLAPLAGWLVNSVGWRTGYRLYGIALWALLIPMLLIVLRRSPRDKGLLPDGEIPKDTPPEEPISSVPDEPAGLTLKQAIKTRTFWLIAVGFMLPMFAGRALLIHLVPIITDSGISAETAASVYGFTVGLSIVGRLGFGYAADRFSVRRIYALCYAVEAIGIFCLVGLGSYGNIALIGFIIVFGMSYGGGMSLSPLLIGKSFGIAFMGEIFGALGIAAMVGGAIGPVFAGYNYDHYGTYHYAFIVFLATQLIAVAAIYNSRSALGQAGKPLEAAPVGESAS